VTTTGPATDPELDELERRTGPLVPPRRLGLLLAVGGAIGLLASFVLAVERFRLAEDPGYVPSCSINPVLSCGSVMVHWQAALFGFPNPLLGIGAFSVAALLGVLLLSGTALPRWVQQGFWAGMVLGLVFVLWLASQTLWSIHALCPYCVVVWAVVVPMAWTTTADALDRGLVPAPARARGAVTALVEQRVLLTAATYALLLVAVAVEFWDYWRTLLP